MPQPSVDPLPPLPRSRFVLLILDDRAATLATMVDRAGAEHGLAAEAVVCADTAEAVTRLRSGRRYSAVIADQAHPGLDQVGPAARRAATPVLAVGGHRHPGPGVAAQVTGPDRPQALAWAVKRHARAVPHCDRTSGFGSADPGAPGPARPGRLVAVCGTGGTGASTVAAALAGQLARPPGDRGLLLADFALGSDQAVLHGLDEPATSLLDLIALARHRRASPDQLRRLTVATGDYRLLPGLRRPSHWTAVGPAAFDAVLCGLRAGYDIVVADVTGEFEGEAEVGSIDVEERNHMARQATLEADLVVVVGRPGTTGSRRLGLTLDALAQRGIDRDRVQPVVNRVGRPDPGADRPSADPPGRARPAIRLPDLAGGATWSALTSALGPLLGATVTARLAQPRRPVPSAVPIPVAAGSIGCWPGSQPA